MFKNETKCPLYVKWEAESKKIDSRPIKIDFKPIPEA